MCGAAPGDGECGGVIALARHKHGYLHIFFRVHIHFCGNGHLGLRFYSASLLKSPKVSKRLLPHHSAPRCRSVYPTADLEPWAAAKGHPWPSAANPASCRVAHGSRPTFGQRGLTGRLRSKAKSKARRPESQPVYVNLPCGIFCLYHCLRGQARSYGWIAFQS